MPFPGPRQNALPENTTYTDSGCELFGECLSCPFPDCLHQGQRDSMRYAYQQRLSRVRDLVARKLSAQDISHQTGLSVRTVFRLKRELTHSL